MSNTTVIYPIVTALVKAEELIGPGRSWRATNQAQERFLKESFEPCRKESGSIAEIESIASFRAEEINRFLSKRGFKIQLRPFAQNTQWKEFGVASVLDLLVKWLKPGKATTLKTSDGQSYAAARQDTEVSSFYRAAGHDYPIAQLKTTSSDLVFLTRLDHAAADFELLHYTRRLVDSIEPINDYSGVVFPMVDLKQEVDVSWLIDLESSSASGQPVKITQALQETHLALNEKGARAKSAFAATIVQAAYRTPRPDLIIDGPFLIWFERPGLSEPLFVGHITKEDWKNPGEL